MATEDKKDTYIVELEAVVDQSFKDMIKLLSTIDKAVKENAQSFASLNAAVESGAITREEWVKQTSQIAVANKSMAKATGDAERSMEAWNQELQRQASIMNTLPQKIESVTASLNKMKAAGQTSGAQWQVYNAELNRLTDSQNKLNAASKGSVDTHKQVGFAMQNASYQVTDFIVSVQGGQNALRAFGQQAPQLLGGFGAIGATLGLITVGITAAVSAFQALDSEGTKSVEKFTDSIAELEKASNSANATLNLTDTQSFIEEFNKADKVARQFMLTLLEVQQIQAEINFNTAKTGVAALNNEIEGAASTWQRFKGITDDEALFGQAGISANQLKQDITAIGTGSINATQVLQQWSDRLLTANTKTSQIVLKNLQEMAKAENEYAVNKKRNAELVIAAQKAIAEGSTIADPKKQLKEAQDLAKEQEKLAEQLKKQQEAAQKTAITSIDTLLKKNDIQKTSLEILQSEIDALAIATPLYEEQIRLAGEVAKARLMEAEGVKAYGEALKELDKIQKDVIANEVAFNKAQQDKIDAANKTVDEMEASYNKEILGIKEVTKAQKEYEAQLEAIQLQRQEGIISDEDVVKYNEMAKAIRDADQDLFNYSKTVKSVAEGLTQGMGGAIDDMIDGFGEAKFSFEDMVESMLKDLAKLVNELLIIKPLMKAIEDFSFGSSSVSSLSGGTYYAPEPLLVGANTLSSTYVGKSVVTGTPTTGSVSATNESAAVSVVINNNAPVEVSATSSTSADGLTTLSIMIDKQVKQSMSNGVYDRAMRSSYGLSRNPMP